MRRSLLDQLRPLRGSEAQKETIGAYNSQSTWQAAEAEQSPLITGNTEAAIGSLVKSLCVCEAAAVCARICVFMRAV